MRISIFSTICALVVPALTLPSSPSWIEKRQDVNAPWFITRWSDSWALNETGVHTVGLEIGTYDAYVNGFNGFSGSCNAIRVNACNTTICFGGGDQWHVETKVTFNRTTNHTGLWIKHVLRENDGRIVSATGSTDNFVFPNTFIYELYPTDVQGF
ncbi:hypothetical protein F4821DRAFT_248731 [Hypoxylon rubiginosum]|uniref:Uncharacterized protein n=1 Tax=Hypoxylon rubiginosum TaxID=110542 RepID=A0ACC0CMM1_9PEZI|nr:hypothetical protein F4821DRAFT_248731 [Hypoxylon rubiginosum]